MSKQMRKAFAKLTPLEKSKRYMKALKAIQNLHISLDAIGKNLPYLVGMAGEIHVLRELATNPDLSKWDFQIQVRGGQSKRDLDIIHSGKSKRIEVKTSTIKEWYKTKGYGWSF